MNNKELKLLKEKADKLIGVIGKFNIETNKKKDAKYLHDFIFKINDDLRDISNSIILEEKNESDNRCQLIEKTSQECKENKNLLQEKKDQKTNLKTPIQGEKEKKQVQSDDQNTLVLDKKGVAKKVPQLVNKQIPKGISPTVKDNKRIIINENNKEIFIDGNKEKDPKPEWQILEPKDKDDPVNHEESSSHNFKRGDNHWYIIAASIRGRLHEHHGEWRDDNFAIDNEKEWSFIAVCDGAGSAKLSRVGSRIASTKAIDNLKNSLKGFQFSIDENKLTESTDLERIRTFMSTAAYEARNAIYREASNRQCSLNLLHTTFLLVLHIKLQTKHLVASLQVGDGVVAVLDRSNKCTLLGEADHGSNAGETHFLTTPNIEMEFENRVKFTFKNVQAIAVMSDGVADDFFPEQERLIDLFIADELKDMTDVNGSPSQGLIHDVLKGKDNEKKLGKWLKYEKRQSFDDRTLVVEYLDES